MNKKVEFQFRNNCGIMGRVPYREGQTQVTWTNDSPVPLTITEIGYTVETDGTFAYARMRDSYGPATINPGCNLTVNLPRPQ